MTNQSALKMKENIQAPISYQQQIEKQKDEKKDIVLLCSHK